MHFLDAATRNLFFTGKGGVGKTSMACATAVQLADRGQRVLLVSTDPASNLDEVLGTSISSQPTAIASVSNLFGMNIDPEEAARAYRERMVGPYRGVLPDDAIRSMEEQFSGSCTLEIAAFDEFARLLGDQAATHEYDHVIFDTAPTGHTLRLLTLPSAWTGFMEENTTGTSCIGPLAGLEKQQQIYQQTVKALADEQVTTLLLVARPEISSLEEAARTSRELRKLDVNNQHLIVNGVFQTETSTDEVAIAMEARGRQALSEMPSELRALPQSTIPLASAGIVGIKALRGFGRVSVPASQPRDQTRDLPSIPGFGSMIDALAQTDRGVILVMGKGGVGKTTLASAVAVALAERGCGVHLSTTDPAAHVAGTLAAEEVSGLTVGRIDPAAETAGYTREVMETAGRDLDDDGRALLQEDLRSPCTEEIAVFRAFARAVADGDDGFVVLDTAPTGHTILLLDSALAYHREVSRQANLLPESVRHLLPRLRDPAFTRVLLATLPEATPVHEAAALQQDLRRAGIDPFGWVINNSLLPLDVTDPVLSQRRLHEYQFVREVEGLTRRIAVVPWQLEPPVGLSRLRHLAAMLSPRTH